MSLNCALKCWFREKEATVWGFWTIQNYNSYGKNRIWEVPNIQASWFSLMGKITRLSWCLYLADINKIVFLMLCPWCRQWERKGACFSGSGSRCLVGVAGAKTRAMTSNRREISHQRRIHFKWGVPKALWHIQEQRSTTKYQCRNTLFVITKLTTVIRVREPMKYVRYWFSWDI